jgi:hypothetical protein
MSVAEMMALFRKRGDAVRALQNVVLVPSLNETTEKVFDNLVHVVDVSHELHQLCLQNHNLAEKLLSLWKRTHWPLCTRETMLGEAAEWRAAASKGPVEVNAIVPDHHDYARINLYEMVPFESINDADIRTIGELDERRYLLVRVLALPIVRQHGYQFLAEDRLGNPFWVFSSSLRAPSHEDLTFVDELARVGTVFAIISPILHMYVFNWEPQLTCSYNQSRVIQIEDLSNSLLRVTPWFEEPCTTALDWKQRGNARFCAQRFHAAMECFTHGIALESTIDLLANRAAAYLKTGNWEGAVADCDAVLARDDAHRKCVMRRAAAR